MKSDQSFRRSKGRLTNNEYRSNSTYWTDAVAATAAADAAADETESSAYECRAAHRGPTQRAGRNAAVITNISAILFGFKLFYFNVATHILGRVSPMSVNRSPTLTSKLAPST